MNVDTTLDPDGRTFMESTPVGVLATARSAGQLRQSTVYFATNGASHLTAPDPHQ